MSSFAQNNRIFILLFFLLIVLVAFLFISYKVKTGREEILREKAIQLNQSQGIIDNSFLCLEGNQSDRSRYCPALIRGGTFVNEQIRLNCSNNENFSIDFNGQAYRCSDQSKITSLVNKYLRAMRR